MISSEKQQVKIPKKRNHHCNSWRQFCYFQLLLLFLGFLLVAMVISFRIIHLANEFDPIGVTEFGIVISLKE